MATSSSLEVLQSIHCDLIALSESRLLAVDRLLGELEGRLEEFRALLQKKPRNDDSRRKLSAGQSDLQSQFSRVTEADSIIDTLDLDDQQYRINEGFRQNVIEIADELDLDELESAQLLLDGQEHAFELDRSSLVTAILRFHQRRQFLLENLQIILQILHESNVEGAAAEALQTFVDLVLEDSDRQVGRGAKYWRQCMQSMTDIEAWLQRLTERAQRISILGETYTLDASQILDLESGTLTAQHESLAAISTYLVQGNLEGADLRMVVEKAKRLEKHDMIMIHYLPILLRLMHDLGQSGGHLSNEEVELLSPVILSEGDNEQWSLRGLHAAAVLTWFVQAASRDIRLPPLANADKKGTVDERIAKLLQDGALHFLLSAAQDVRRSEWPDPVKKAIIDYLLQDAVRLPNDAIYPAPPFQAVLISQLQEFCDAMITHAPDTLRQMRQEADEERRALRTRIQGGVIEAQPNLERFLVIIAYAYDQDSDHAISFWDDQEANLYGFLQWTAKRQTTPRVAAFCEMLRSISQDAGCADAAHRFLLEEGTPIAGKLRRTGSLSWAQIFAELEYYAQHLNSKLSGQSMAHSTDVATMAEQLIEPESALMLECYLRLVTHLCARSQTIRDWILRSETHDLPSVLFQLAATNVESRLRASAFSTLTALLTDKTADVSAHMWSHLDQWVSNGPPASHQPARLGAQPMPTPRPDLIMLDMIYSGYEETNAFVRLLNALVAPAAGNTEFNDTLPFPESLGNVYRKPGISAYVDFVVGRAFGQKSSQLAESGDQLILQLNCLEFMALNLSTFNEDLVVLANTSVVSIDSAIRCSSLEAYVLLHPFARTMEWLYTTRVLSTLFAAAHQEVDTVNSANLDSPLVLSVIRSIEVMNLVLKLQETYLDIVRPLIQKEGANRKLAQIESDVSTFEDATLGNLQLVVDLGLYCGTGHQDLIIPSLALLERLSSSRKLSLAHNAGFGKRPNKNKLLGMLEKEEEAERIARSLASSLAIDEREVEAGSEAAGYIIKTRILSFLLNSLTAADNRPAMAHALLGFDCYSSEKGIVPTEQFIAGDALFQVVAKLALNYAPPDQVPLQSWTESIKLTSLEIMQSLWRAPMTTYWIMSELQAADFVYGMALRQIVINPGLEFDGKLISDSDFTIQHSAITLQNVLKQRAIFFDLLTRSIRLASTDGLAGDLTRLLSTINGRTTFPGGISFEHPTIFDLFDFQTFSIPESPTVPNISLTQTLDLRGCEMLTASGRTIYNIQRVQQILSLQRNQIFSGNQILQIPQTPQALQDISRIDEESTIVTLCFLGMNHYQELLAARLSTLQAWSKLITIALQACNGDAKARSTMSSQILQTISPLLESSFAEDLATTLELTRLARNVMVVSHAQSSTQQQSLLLENHDDRTFAIFRACYSGLVSNMTTSELRELCYQTCFHYLRSILASVHNKAASRRRLILRSLKVLGDTPIRTICDDAYSGAPNCRVSALSLLNELVTLANAEESKPLLEVITGQNLLGVLIESIRTMPQDLAAAAPTEINALISITCATLTLLLCIVRTRNGATQVLNAGFFAAVRDSGLFSADPDLGFDIESTTSLGHFFTLLDLIIRIINAALISKGTAHEQTLRSACEFLTQYRSFIVSIFKRHAAIGGSRVGTLAHQGTKIDLTGLVDGFTLLISATDFLQLEDAPARRGPKDIFS